MKAILYASLYCPRCGCLSDAVMYRVSGQRYSCERCRTSYAAPTIEVEPLKEYIDPVASSKFVESLSDESDSSDTS